MQIKGLSWGVYGCVGGSGGGGVIGGESTDRQRNIDAIPGWFFPSNPYVQNCLALFTCERSVSVPEK